MINLKATASEIFLLILFGVSIGIFMGVIMERASNGYMTADEIWEQAHKRGYARMANGSKGASYIWEEPIDVR